MNENIVAKTIKVIESNLNKDVNFDSLDIKTESLPLYDNIYFGDILKMVKNENLLLNPKLGIEKTTKGILINIGIHNVFHEFLKRSSEDELEDEFLKLVKIYEVKKLKYENFNFNLNEILEEICYGFLNLLYFGSKIDSKRAMVDRAILSNIYYDSIITKSWWGYEVNVEEFYKKLEEIEKLPSKKIRNMIKEMGYFTLV